MHIYTFLNISYPFWKTCIYPFVRPAVRPVVRPLSVLCPSRRPSSVRRLSSCHRRVADAPKPLPGTPSTLAIGLFEKHFKNLSIMRREMIEFRCRRFCKSAAEHTLIRGYIIEVRDWIERFGIEHKNSIVDLNSFLDYTGVPGENRAICSQSTFVSKGF